jgi:hypothetical protein
MLRAALLWILFAVTSFGSTTFSFQLLNPTPVVGTPFEVEVTLTTGQVIAGYQFDAVFTPTLQVLSITETGFFLTEGLGLAWDSIDNTNGVVSFLNNVTVGLGGLTGSDSLMRIEFLPASPGSVTLDFQNVLAIDENFEFVLPDTESLTFLVESPPRPREAEVPEPGSLALTAAAIGLLAARLKLARKFAAAWQKTSTSKP